MTGSQPYIGQTDEVTVVGEYKVEIVFEEKILPEVLKAFRLIHLYETPAFDVYKLETFE